MASSGSTLILVSTMYLLVFTGFAENQCRESKKCRNDGPIIRFPFKNKNENQQPEECSSHGFQLSCSPDHETMLELPELPAIQLPVKSINYSSHVIELYDSASYDTAPCQSEKILKLVNKSNIKPFTIGVPAPLVKSLGHQSNITFFDCSSSGHFSCPIFKVFGDDYSDYYYDRFLFCAKIFYFSSVTVSSDYDNVPNGGSLFLHWDRPDCTECENEGKSCKLKKNGTIGETECFQLQLHIHKSRLWIVAVSVAGLILIGLVVFFVNRVQKLSKMLEEDEVRVEIFLEDYRVLKPTRFYYADIKRITNGFKEKLGEGAHGAVFKGKLSSDIVVAVKMLNNSKRDGQEFINEVGTMGKIHHVNVVRLAGFCADGHHRALVYEFYPHGSLQNYISSPDDKSVFLGWEKLHGIALGIARGIEYLHHGCEQRILHFDINPHNVVLDDDCTPKITDFGLAKLCSRDRSTVTVTAAKGTLGYIAPEVFSRNFGNGNVSYKSDVYSYGMLLLEMVGGKKNMEQPAEEVFHVLYPEWIHNLLEGKDIHIHMDGEDDIQIAKRLATVGLWCIQWHPVDRPHMKSVIQMLEGEGDMLTLPPNPLDKAKSRNPNSSVPARRPLNLALEVIQESE